MSTTENYELPIDDTRYPSLEAMIKLGFEKIDASLKQIEDSVAALETRVATLEAAP